MQMEWYVIQVYAGYEKVVKAELEKGIEDQGLEDKFGEILIPSAKMKHFFGLGDAMKDQQLFPGYMLVQMVSEPETFKLVSKAPRVLKFLGGKSPMPLSQKEIDRILAQIKGEIVVSGEAHQFEEGKEVEIKEGPFGGFVGIIDSIDQDSEKLTVMVSIFGRMTPVELAFDQVKH